MVTKQALAVALETLLAHVRTSTDVRSINIVYIPPAEALRNKALAIEKKDSDIKNAIMVLNLYKQSGEN